MTDCPILQFRRICMDSGVHTLSFLAVLCRVESGDSCRKVAKSLGMAYSSVWRAAIALEQQGLLALDPIPLPQGGGGTRFRLALSPRGEALITALNAMLTPSPEPILPRPQ